MRESATGSQASTTALFRSIFFERARGYLVPWFSFRGGIDRRAFSTRILVVVGVTSVSFFLPQAGGSQSAILAMIGIVLSSLLLRRLRDAGFSLAWLFLGLAPVVGWLLLGVLCSREGDKSRNSGTTFTPEGVAKTSVTALATFFTLALFFSSVSFAAANSAVLQSDSSTSWQSSGSQSDALEDLAAAERVAAEEAEAARLAEVERQADEQAAGADGAQDGGEASGGPDSGLTQIDQTFEELVASLRVEPEFIGGYQRTLFRHWIDANGNGCDTRREVLIVESITPVTVGPGCSISGGTWYSAFDGVTTTNPSDFDIDHFVPLAEAWRSGAHAWDSATRQRFANDLGYEMSLIAVSASSNRSKGDRDPAKWMPPNTSFICEYVYSWVNIKLRWSLAVDSNELSAINRNWSGCSLSSLSLSPRPPAAPVTQTPAPAPAPEARAEASAPDSGGTAPPLGDQSCVDVNTAAIDELLRIIHIGPVRAEELIGLRPFSSVDQLTRINGIGPSRISDIKAEGLACVG